MGEKGPKVLQDSKRNLILLTDSYKLTHWNMYPESTEKVYSYFESRGGRFPEVVFFGLQYLLKQYLEGVVITKEMIDEAESYCRKTSWRQEAVQ